MISSSQMQRRPPSVRSSGLEGTVRGSAKSLIRSRGVGCGRELRAHLSRSARDYLGRTSDIDSSSRRIVAFGIHMLSGNEPPANEATNDEGRLVSLGGLASALFRERLDDRLVSTFLPRGQGYPQIAAKTAICEAMHRARKHACQHAAARLFGGWLIAMKRH